MLIQHLFFQFDQYILSNLKYNIMKTFSKILVWGGVATGIAYLTKKVWDLPSLESRNSRDGTMGERHKAGVSARSNSSANSGRDTSSYSNERTQKMYKELGMTEDQRRRYEADYRAVMDTWEKNNPNKPMDEKMKVKEHNSALNAVLNEDQFSMYRKWTKKNPYYTYY